MVISYRQYVAYLIDYSEYKKYSNFNITCIETFSNYKYVDLKSPYLLNKPKAKVIWLCKTTNAYYNKSINQSYCSE